VTILSISSHVVAGRVGNQVALPAFAALELEAWSLPTVIYSDTPSPAGFAGDTVPLALVGAILDRFEADETAARLSAIHVGYVREAAMVSRIARFLGAAKAANPDLVVSVDPVLGDDGKLYVPQATAQAIKDELLPRADLVTPNLFELGWLTGHAIGDLDAAIAAARSLARHQVLVTSAPSAHTAQIGTLLVERGRAFIVSTPRLEGPPHGSGDLLAALFAGRLLRKEPPAQALELAVASVYALIGAAAGAASLPVTQHQKLLAAPANRFRAVQIGGEKPV